MLKYHQCVLWVQWQMRPPIESSVGFNTYSMSKNYVSGTLLDPGHTRCINEQYIIPVWNSLETDVINRQFQCNVSDTLELSPGFPPSIQKGYKPRQRLKEVILERVCKLIHEFKKVNKRKVIKFIFKENVDLGLVVKLHLGIWTAIWELSIGY